MLNNESRLGGEIYLAPDQNFFDQEPFGEVLSGLVREGCSLSALRIKTSKLAGWLDGGELVKVSRPELAQVGVVKETVFNIFKEIYGGLRRYPEVFAYVSIQESGHRYRLDGSPPLHRDQFDDDCPKYPFWLARRLQRRRVRVEDRFGGETLLRGLVVRMGDKRFEVR